MTMPPDPGSESRSAQRRARREYIRTHHPDAGGDDETFITGLADFDAAQRLSAPAGSRDETVTPWPVSLTTVVLRRLRRRYYKFRAR